jgi:hypothetical protein
MLHFIHLRTAYVCFQTHVHTCAYFYVLLRILCKAIRTYIDMLSDGRNYGVFPLGDPQRGA